MTNWLAPFLKHARLSQEELADRMGKSRVTISRYATGHTDLKPNIAEQMAEVLKVNSADLLAASMGKASQPDGSSAISLVQIPDLNIFGGMGNGGALSVVQSDNGNIDAEYVRGFWSFPDYLVKGFGSLKNIYAWEAKGDSMEPTIQDGSVVFVDTGQISPPPDDVYAIDYGDGLVVKRLQLVPLSPDVRVISDNNLYDAYTLPREDVRVYGRVVGWFQWRG